MNGTLGGGDPAQVEIFLNGSCTGTAAAIAPADQFTGAGITISVPSDATTAIAARAVDSLGNRGLCSASIDYVEDSTGGAPFTPGALSAGDNLFPEIGNGGYDVEPLRGRARLRPGDELFNRGTQTTITADATQNLSRVQPRLPGA